MPIRNYLLLAGLLIACNPATKEAASPAFDEEAEKKAILETIETETRSFFTNKPDAWRACYILSDETSTAWNNSDGTFDVFRGFKAIEAYALKSMQENPIDTANTPPLQLQYRNVKVKFFSPEAAFVQFNEYLSDSKGENFHQTFDERIMQKESGKWKIYNVSSFWNYKNKLPIDSLK